MSLKVAILGSPHSGKSCLREGLKWAIWKLPAAPYPYIISAQPDGEGAWFSITCERDMEAARELKAAAKKKFTWEFAEQAAGWVRTCNEPLVLVDTGGWADEKNEMICAGAGSAVVLYADADQLAQWRGFCGRVGLPVLAELLSDYHAGDDRVEGVGEDGVLRGSVHYLERGVPVDSRPAIQALARHILERAGR